jgi:plastocyanin
MTGAARPIAVLAACGLLAAATSAALAPAATTRPAAHPRRAARAHRCAAPSRPHRRGSGHGARCRTTRHRAAARHGVAVWTPTVTPPSPTPVLAPPGVGVPSEAPGTTAGGGEAGGPAPPPALTRVQVSAVEFRFTLSRTTVPAGRIVFELVNDGQDEHNLNLASGGSLAGSFSNTQPKGVQDQTIDMRPGSYTLFCSLPEHEAKGMKATLTVQ